MRHKRHASCGYLKMHVSVNIKKMKILATEMTREEVHDWKVVARRRSSFVQQSICPIYLNWRLKG